MISDVTGVSLQCPEKSASTPNTRYKSAEPATKMMVKVTEKGPTIAS